MAFTGEQKAAMDAVWKVIEKILGLALIGAYLWIWNAEARLSKMEGAASSIRDDVTEIKGDVKEFKDAFTAFLIKQAEERGRHEAEGNP